MTDCADGCKTDSVENNRTDYRTLFEDKRAFRRFCEYLGIPTTEYGKATLPNKLNSGSIADAAESAKCPFPAIIQGRKNHDTGGNYAIVIGDPSDEEFLASVEDIIGDNREVVISRFRTPCIPVSVTAFVSDVDILLAASCVELHIPDRPGSNFVLKNYGFDLDAFKDQCRSDDAFKDIARDLKRSAMRICKALQLRGFHSALTIDAIICGSDVRFVSVNNCSKSFPAEYTAFRYVYTGAMGKNNILGSKTGDEPGEYRDLFGTTTKELEDFTPNVSMVLYRDGSGEHDSIMSRHLRRIAELHGECGLGELEKEIEGKYGLNCIAFPCNIVSIACGRVTYNPNILPLGWSWDKNRDKDQGRDWEDMVLGKDTLALKLELINRGIRGEEYGKPHHLLLKTKTGELRVKVSAGERIASISPFSVSEGKLCFWGEPFADAEVLGDPYSLSETTSRGVPISDICEVEDRTLRVRHCPGCEYVRRGSGCRYCKYTAQDFSMHDFREDDIREAIEKIKLKKDKGETEFDRIKIGGGCIVDPHDAVVESITKVAKQIRTVFGDAIELLLACPPPSMQTDIKTFHDAGIDGIIISVEVFDPPKSKEYLPGKDRVPLSAFYYTLKHAVTICGGDKVYSKLIAGLESPETTREGCGHISSTGARAVISPFRPIAGTDLEDIMPLPAEELYSLCIEVLKDGSGSGKDALNMSRDPETVVMPAGRIRGASQ